VPTLAHGRRFCCFRRPSLLAPMFITMVRFSLAFFGNYGVFF
jgi:hypothetical protein